MQVLARNDCRLLTTRLASRYPLTSTPSTNELARHSSDLPRRLQQNTENVGSYVRRLAPTTQALFDFTTARWATTAADYFTQGDGQIGKALSHLRRSQPRRKWAQHCSGDKGISGLTLETRRQETTSPSPPRQRRHLRRRSGGGATASRRHSATVSGAYYRPGDTLHRRPVLHSPSATKPGQGLSRPRRSWTHGHRSKVNVVSRHVTGHLHHREVVVQPECVDRLFQTTTGLVLKGYAELWSSQSAFYWPANFLAET